MYVKQSYSTPVILNAMQSSALDVVKFAMNMYKDCNLQETAKD